jgi:hypothetical protein
MSVHAAEMAILYRRGGVGLDADALRSFSEVMGVAADYIASAMIKGDKDMTNTCETTESATVRYINHLRGHEGDSVTILCDNPDFNGQPNCAILCNGEWTDYDDLRFAGETVLQCLARACEAKDGWHQAQERGNRYD